MPTTPQSIELNIQGKSFEGELWKKEDNGGKDSTQTPIIALHGWLDNCHSFRPLAPLLNNTQIFALDMAGHGHSAHRSQDASYHIWDDVREVLLIAKKMGWDKFILLGHSRGAIISAMIAAVAPEQVSRLVLIEGLKPLTVPVEETARQLQKFIRAYLGNDSKQKNKKERKDLSVLIKGRMQAGFEIGEPAARLLVERSIRKTEGNYSWRTDPRLMMPSPLMLSSEAADSFIDDIKAETLLICGDKVMGSEKALAQPWYLSLQAKPHFNVIIFPGGHHVHMEESATEVAKQINQFIRGD